MCPSPFAFLARPGGELVEVRPWRRFFARSVDLMIAWIIVVVVLTVLRLDVSTINANPLRILAAGVWTGIEPVFLMKWGATPGKWLVNTRVASVSGAPMTYRRAFNRSLLVVTWGLFYLIPFVTLPCLAVAYEDLKSTKSTRWDRGNFQVVHGLCRGWRRVAVAALVVLLLFIGAAAVKA